MTADAPNLSIVFDPAADPIGGELIDRQGRCTRFDGWLDLLALIDQAWLARVPRRSGTEDGSRTVEEHAER